ncbi:MAG: transporter substrate-binding domain-containing protein [Chloroflexi bacterium]|nr:transporter substrate-binding domain-containing protein [Chloroflexota bacterium]
MSTPSHNLFDRRHATLWVIVPVTLALVGVLAWLAWRAFGGDLRRDDTWARIRREGVLRVGTEASYPPFETIDDQGQFAGYDVDLARALAARWGVEVQFVNVHFDGLYDALLTDKCDLIISALPYDRTRTRDVGYSQTYFEAGQVLVATADDLRIQGIEDLGDARVAVELGAEGHQLARQYARDKGLVLEIVPLRETLAVFEALRNGEVDALIADRVTALQYQGAGYPLRLAGPALTSDPYVIATPRDAPITLARINEALDQWRADGWLESLTQRWFGGQ